MHTFLNGLPVPILITQNRRPGQFVTPLLNGKARAKRNCYFEYVSYHHHNHNNRRVCFHDAVKDHKMNIQVSIISFRNLYTRSRAKITNAKRTFDNFKSKLINDSFLLTSFSQRHKLNLSVQFRLVFQYPFYACFPFFP